MAKRVATFHDTRIYNLTSGATLPTWISDKKKRDLAKDADFRRRIELVQDLEFPTASQRLGVSRDGQYLAATGTYQPAVRVFDLHDLSLKFERRLDCECVDFGMLSDDYTKLVFLQADRHVEFHAAYGKHYRLRVPCFGRSLTFHHGACELFVGAAGEELYRLDLAEGRFKAPLPCAPVNKLAINPMHQLVAAACETGEVRCFDPRARKPVACLDLAPAVATALAASAAGAAAADVLADLQATALAFDTDGLTMAVGASSAHCLLYDLRSSRPLHVKQHQNGLPVTNVSFHGGGARNVLSSDGRLVKIWARDGRAGQVQAQGTGTTVANFETPSPVNDLCVVRDARGDSGLLLLAAEQPRVMAYYLPELGPAPRWCSFLDTITEELEETGSTTVFDDYKFVTKHEVDALGLAHLVGTPLMRGYMHGFFMDAQLYNRVHALSQPFAYDEWRKQKVQDKIKEKQQSRISFQAQLPEVNRDLAQRLLSTDDAPPNKRKRTKKAAGAGSAEAGASLFADSRFGRVFTDSAFQIDPESEEFKLRFPSGVAGPRSDARADEDSEEEEQDSADQGHTAAMEDRWEEDEGEEHIDGEEAAGWSSDDMEMPLHAPTSQDRSAARTGPVLVGEGGAAAAANRVPKKRKAPGRLRGVQDSEDALLMLGGAASRAALHARRKVKAKPLGARLSAAAAGAEHTSSRVGPVKHNGLAREIVYQPKSNSKGKGRVGRGSDDAPLGESARPHRKRQSQGKLQRKGDRPRPRPS